MMELGREGVSRMKKCDFSRGEFWREKRREILRIEDGDKLGSLDEREGKGSRDDETTATAFAC